MDRDIRVISDKYLSLLNGKIGSVIDGYVVKSIGLSGFYIDDERSGNSFYIDVRNGVMEFGLSSYNGSMVGDDLRKYKAIITLAETDDVFKGDIVEIMSDYRDELWGRV